MTARDFWSRRKAAVARETASDEKQDRARIDEEKAKALEALPDEEVLRRLDLPDPDSLGIGDDFKRFMATGVPERLRRRALRRLWRTNPVLANLDGLNDYDGDFTDAATVVENLKTAYQVGKGMLRHVEALQEQASDGDEPAEDHEIPEADHPDDTADTHASDDSGAAGQPDGPKVGPVQKNPSKRVRMRYTFGKDTGETA